MVRLPFVAVRPRAVKAPPQQRIRLLRSASALVTMDVQAPRSKAVLRILGPSAIPTAIVSADTALGTIKLLLFVNLFSFEYISAIRVSRAGSTIFVAGPLNTRSKS